MAIFISLHLESPRTHLVPKKSRVPTTAVIRRTFQVQVYRVAARLVDLIRFDGGANHMDSRAIVQACTTVLQLW